jgi:hypothetical protein
MIRAPFKVVLDANVLYPLSKGTQIDGKAGSGEHGERWESREAIAECAHRATSSPQSTGR